VARAEEKTMKTQLDVKRIASGLRAERRGKVTAAGGYFGAMQVLADVEAQFRSPVGAAARGTRPAERRLVLLGVRSDARAAEWRRRS
jgi:hypothetical protein